MKNKKKFSIIVLNYNNFNYLFEMIDSVYNQIYNNIEMIIIDDASIYFDKNKILKYVNDKNKNINIQIIINKINIGTVKNVNKALKYATGDYYLITASDDVLANNETISNYVKYFEKTNSNIIASQWIICDNKLNKIKKFIPSYKMKLYNKSQKLLLFDMCKSNRFGSGATAYKKEIFNRYSFDEKYRYLEDWPFWLNALFNNEKIYFAPFSGLLHRGGGISESHTVKGSTLLFYKELLDTFHKEIIPKLSLFNNYQKWSILDSYKYNIEFYKKYLDISQYENELNTLKSNKKIRKYFIINELNPHIIRKIIVLWKYNRIVPYTFILTIIISSLIFKLFKNNNFKLIILVFTYTIIYVGLVLVQKVRSRKKWKNIQ